MEEVNKNTEFDNTDKKLHISLLQFTRLRHCKIFRNMRNLNK